MMRSKKRFLSFLLLPIALLCGACAAEPSIASISSPAPVSSSAEPDAIPEEDNACATCELPEIESLPEGFSLAYPEDITEDAPEIQEFCPPLGEGDAETAPADEPGVYRKLSYQEAKEWMDSKDDILVVDVRTKEEYEAGHIPGAILIPNETIGNMPPDELPDTGAKILIYCRSGNRSYQASLKLLEMGYDFIYDFGGINGWPYEVITGAGS